eukprot:Nitzschia sp. Nitz4//scaffold67_size101165//80902//82521//NITZ4_004540-RA/size101165-processed-gene-0.120-mRNA-1//-1//CDS//3329556507//192//frame0
MAPPFTTPGIDVDGLSSHDSEVVSLADNTGSNAEESHFGKDIDAMLAADLNRMSVQERNNLIEELHGVEGEIEETPEFVEECLHMMHLELERARGRTYQEAMQANSDYITSRRFGLMFLRASSFDPIKAAIRMGKFLKEKKQMFGAHTLGRPLYLSDLDKDEMKALKSGLHQIFPSRNMAGKIVLGTFPRHIPDELKHPRMYLKVVFYMVSSLVEFDEETQRRGLVVLLWALGPHSINVSPEIPRRMGQMIDIVPIRVTGIHMCTDDHVIATLKSIIVATMNRHARVRLRLHTGSATECQYSIMSFGIPVNSLPLASDQDLRTGNQTKWIAKQKVKDRLLKRDGTFDKIDIPGLHDVILGRGKVFQDHSGNQHMRSYVRELLDDFKISEKDGKRVATEKVVSMVHAKMGRFLKRNDDGWFETVSEKEAFEKVAASFRTMLSVRNKAESNTPSFVVPVEGKRSRIFLDGAEPMCFLNI